MTTMTDERVADEFRLGEIEDFDHSQATGSCTVERDLGIMPAYQYRTLPTFNVTGEGPQQREKIVGDKRIRIYRLQNVFVGRRGVIFSEDGLLFSSHTAPFGKDIVKNPDLYSYVMSPYGFSWKKNTHKFARHFEIPNSFRIIEEPVFLTSSYWEQAYTHFLIELLPALALWRQFHRDIKLLVSKNVYEARRDIFTLAGVGLNEVFTKETDELLYVKELLVADFPRFTSPETAEFLEEAIGRHFQPFAQSEKSGQPIYLARHDEFAWDRFVLNEPELISGLQKRGFRIFVPSRHSFREQLETITQAPLVIGQYGGALFNLLLGIKHKNVIILSSEDYLRFHFDAMNPFLKHNAVRLICRSFSARRDPNNSPFFVHIPAFNKLVDSILS